MKMKWIICALPVALLSPLCLAGEGQLVTGNKIRISTCVFDVPVNDKLTFAALRRPEGTVSGQFQFEHRFRVDGIENRENVVGTVECMTVEGNRVRVGGTVRHSNSPLLPVGSQMIWSVTDNGGKKDQGPPDTASELLGTGNAAAFCAAGGFPPESPIIDGSVQVRP